MAVRSNTDTLEEAMAESESVSEEREGWDDDSNGSDHQEQLDRHALVSHGKQIAAVQDQLAQVVEEMGSLRRLCVTVRDSARKTNSMLETLGTHLGVQLHTDDAGTEEPAG